MDEKEANEIIIYLKAVVEELRPMYITLMKGGFDSAGDDVIDGMVSLFTAATRIQDCFTRRSRGERWKQREMAGIQSRN